MVGRCAPACWGLWQRCEENKVGSESPPSASSRRPSGPTWTLGLVSVVAILVTYVRVYRGEFLWDDDAHIYANPTIVGPLGLKEIWTSGKANYFPLTMTS